MPKFTMPVHWYMSAPVHTVLHDIDLNALHHRFIKLAVSSLPVRDDNGNLAGLVSRTDLLQRVALHHPIGGSDDLLVIPATGARVREIMTPAVVTLDYEDTVAEAAQTMLEANIHRVYITQAGHLTGVLSARDIMPAVADLRLDTPVSHFMSTPLFVIGADETLGPAMSLLLQAQVQGVVVLGEAGPMGVFTQAEALQCRNLPMDAPVVDAMDTAILTIDTDTPMYMAAGEAVEKNTRRIVVVDRNDAQGDVRGIVTPYDFLTAALG